MLFNACYKEKAGDTFSEKRVVELLFSLLLQFLAESKCIESTLLSGNKCG